MAEPGAHSQLVLELEQLGRDLDDELGDRDLSVDVVRAVRVASAAPRTPWRRGRRIAVAVAALVAMIAVVPPARATVAHWFRIGSVSVEPPDSSLPPTTAPLPPSFKRFESLGDLVTLDAARQKLPVPTPADLPLPDQVRLDPKIAQHVSLIYRAGPGLPVISEGDGAGLLVEEFPANGREIVRKYLMDPNAATPIEVNGQPGVFLAGGKHWVFYDLPDGTEVDASGRVSANAVIFPLGDRTIRIEADLDRDRLVEIARSLR